MRLVSADRRWEGRRVITAAPGPSLTAEVAEACRGEIVLAVNDAVRLLPFADACYACDSAWWMHHKGLPDFAGERWTSHSLAPKNDKRAIADKYRLHVIAGEDAPGFSRDPARIFYANNSGFQTVNLAILFGADPIILVGFDMREIKGRRHFFGNHPAPLRNVHPFGLWIQKFTEAAKMLGPAPRIINATPGSALTCFPMMPLDEALGRQRAA